MFLISKPLSKLADAFTKALLSLSDANKKRVAIIGVCVMTLAVCIEPSIAHAAANDGKPTGNTSTDILNTINVGANWLIRVMSSIFWPVLLMIGSLLDNGLIFGGPMEERLLSAWAEIRNLVNIFFVLILVAVALYNVLGLGNDGGPLPLGYKAVMPKFVLALIVVNFSFTAVKVVLDVSNVVTGAVFALPTKTIDTSSLPGEMETQICGKRAKDIPIYAKWCTQQHKFNEEGKEYFNRLDRNNIAVVYAIRYGKATELKFIRDGIKDIGQLGFNIVFNLILFTIYTVGYIALFLVLASRLVVVWIALVLSPLFALSIVLPSLLSSIAGEAGGVGEKLKGTILAPITIGIALSVGYIMLDALGADASVDPLLVSTSLTSLDPNSLPTDINTLQQLLLAVGSVIVIWTGIFAGTSNTFAAPIIDSMKSSILGAGKFLGSLPLYAQWIPIKGLPGQPDQNASIKDMELTFRNARSGFDQGRVKDLLHPVEQLNTTDIDSLNRIKGGNDALLNVMTKLPHALRTELGWKEIVSYMKSNKEKVTDDVDLRKKIDALPSSGQPNEQNIKDLAQLIAEGKQKGGELQRIGQTPGFGTANDIVNAIKNAAGSGFDPMKYLEALNNGAVVTNQPWAENFRTPAGQQTLVNLRGLDQRLQPNFSRINPTSNQLEVDAPITAPNTLSAIKSLFTSLDTYNKSGDDAARKAEALKQAKQSALVLGADKISIGKVISAVGFTVDEKANIESQLSQDTAGSNGALTKQGP